MGTAALRIGMQGGAPLGGADLAAPVPMGRRVAIGLVAVAAAVYVLRAAEAFLIPIVLAVLVSYALSPLVEDLLRRQGYII